MDTYEKKIDIPFGAFDSDLVYQEINIPHGFKATIEENKIILKKAESEEDIRTGLINGFNECLKNSQYPKNAQKYWHNIKIEDILAWLENLGKKEQDPCEHCNDKCLNCHNFPCVDKREFERGKSAMEAIKEENIDNVNKVEPKFKVGDWIVENGVNGNTIQITKFEEHKGVGMRVWFSNGTGTYIDFLKGYHLWSIQDAKPGDVLTDGKKIVIFKQFVEPAYAYRQHIIAYIGLDIGGDIQITDDTWTFKEIKPATQEQRELLFQKMEDSGYKYGNKFYKKK